MTNASKGHLMKRGTLMVLKRLFATVLGALGLGALAAGSAFAQTPGEGNIPAPNVYDDQVTCTANLPSLMTRMPTQIPMGGMSSPLDDAIGMGSPTWATIDPKAADADPDGVYENLVYVIPPMGSNCGGTLPFGAMDVFTDPNDLTTQTTIGASADTQAVAAGYSELLPLFAAVYGAPDNLMDTGTAGALAAAQKALSEAIADGTTGAALTPLQDAVDEAQEDHNEAMAKFTDASAGPIYQAGVAEWMAKAAVTKSIDTYNMRVNGANMAQMELDELAYRSYVPLANNSLLTVVPVTDGMAGTIDQTTLATYANAVVGMTTAGTIDPMTGVTTSTVSNFTSTGVLIVPMELDDSTTDPDDLRPVYERGGTDNLVSAIRSRRDDYAVAAKALQKQADDYRAVTGGDGPLQRAYDEAARRANVESDYYNTLYNTMLADDTNLNGTFAGDGTFTPTPDDAGTEDVDESVPYSIASRNSAYVTANNRRFTAEQDLRAKAAAREMATAHVQSSFSSPTSFYQQLVDRRSALKVAADRRVAMATADGGTASKDLTDAAEAAQKNLDAATMTNNDIQAQFADENDPTLALVQELLKNDGDDGAALVKAIGDTYETAAGAADAAREVVDELTGEGGAVAMNTERSTQNMEDIGALDGRVTQNEEDIAANSTMIMTNAGNIAANAESIMTNTTMIGENRGMIMTNADDIMTNAGNIMTNSGRIDANEAAIGMNTSAIADNAAAIGSNRSGIMQNAGMIGDLQDQMEVVRAGVAASMALAGMPAINGRGISIGVGSYDGESAFAVGFQIQGEMASFKVGVTSAGGETGASAGVGFQF